MPLDDLSGFIDQGVKITGELEFVNTLRIDGVFNGKIRSNDLLIIGQNGIVDGDIEAGVIRVTGIIKGKVRARQRLEVQKGGRVLADVVTPSLLMVDGGMIQGKCEMDNSEAGASARKLE